jgi:CHAT domain-containing protein
MLYERALVIIEKAIGPEHGEVARLLNNLAHLRWVRGDVDGALPLFERAQEVEESQRSLILPMGSEDEAQAYLDKSGEYLQVFLSLARLRPQDARAMHLALTAVLRTKGRVLEVTAGGMESLRRAVAPEDRALLDALVSRRAQLAQIELRDPGAVPPARYRELVGSLRAELEEVERQALRRGGALRVATEPVRLEAIQARIPADAALVEVVAYRSYRSRARPWRRWGQERLAGFVLRREGDPRYADLGPLDEVTRRAFAYREALQGLALPAEERRARAQALHQTVLAPLAPSLEGVDHLLIAPDAALHLVPFAALEDGEGRLLVERLRITYLTSGRDLLRLGLGGASREAPLLVAAPDFDGGGARAEQPPTPVQAAAAPRRSRDFAGMRFAPLPGTRDEATALARLLGVEALTGARAREAALKGAHGPRVLHLATHGFFLADQAAPLPEPRDLAAMERRPPTTESALLRSGLAFTGANRLSDGEDDGILTALELAGLDLTGTQLLVLSACETGLGEVRHGEGVYGLRRAALLAGAEAQLVSLWKVADEPTRRLMESYYRRLLAGEGRSEALRQVQLEMLRDPALAHPYYWAGFVSIGAWGPLALPAKR